MEGGIIAQAEREERIGFIDIECSNLNANFGLILSYDIKERGGKHRGRAITAEELKSGNQDKALVRECVSDMEKFDRLVGFYSGRFDIPFIRTRAMAHDLYFPKYRTIKHTDLWLWVRSKMNMNSNRLAVACKTLKIPAKNHQLDGLLWTRALSGHNPSLRHILIHNREDTESTEILFERLLPFNNLTKTCM